MGGSSHAIYGGKKHRKYHESMSLSSAEADKPVFGGRKKTRRTKWRYIRGMKIRTVRRKPSKMRRKL
jgi:hypothetical protein